MLTVFPHIRPSNNTRISNNALTRHTFMQVKFSNFKSYMQLKTQQKNNTRWPYMKKYSMYYDLLVKFFFSTRNSKVYLILETCQSGNQDLYGKIQIMINFRACDP
jgi:Holliday junction resolvase RusA-like endonuclease